MAKVKFIGVPGEKHDSIVMYGVYMPLGEFVNFPDGKSLKKLAAHPHFEVQGQAEDVAFTEKAVTTTAIDIGQPNVLQVSKVVEKGEPIDAPTSRRAELERAAESMGIKVDGRWSEERLATETQKAAKAK